MLKVYKLEGNGFDSTQTYIYLLEMYEELSKEVIKAKVVLKQRALSST